MRTGFSGVNTQQTPEPLIRMETDDARDCAQLGLGPETSYQGGSSAHATKGMADLVGKNAYLSRRKSRDPVQSR
jgi:hypothetical protein